jgi:uncharacterized protein (TIGR02001 family)
MKNLTKLILGAASVAGMVAIAAPAFADDAPAWGVTGYIAGTTDYKFRGISQNDRTPSPQGSLNVTGPEGFYVGTWLSTVDFDPGVSGNPYLEMDVYGGKHTDLWGVDWNIEPYMYLYPAANTAGGPSPNYFELIDQLTKSFGPVTLQATWAWSPDFSFRTGTGNYLAGNAAYAINDWLSVSANIGHQWVQGAKYAFPIKSRDYTYADGGATATWKGFALDLRYSGTDLGSAQCSAFYMSTRHACAGNFIATLTYNITLFP